MSEETQEKEEQQQDDMVSRREFDALNDKYVRLYAEYENARKLWEKQKVECLQFGSFRIMKDFASVLDDTEAALGSLNEKEHPEYAKGLKMVYAKIKDVLSKEGLQPIEAEGAVFDPHVHEALMFEERGDVPEHTVTAVIQQGYKYGDKVLRPARVKVSRMPAEESSKEV
jgi:molecular chaperone GrpE